MTAPVIQDLFTASVKTQLQYCNNDCRMYMFENAPEKKIIAEQAKYGTLEKHLQLFSSKHLIFWLNITMDGCLYLKVSVFLKVSLKMEVGHQDQLPVYV